MKILVVGGRGNMGSRYCSILEYLNHTPLILEFGDGEKKKAELLGKCDKIIIATPTTRHISQIKEFMRSNKPILCEKPFGTWNPNLKFLLGHKVYMVNNYCFTHQYESSKYDQCTKYDYFKSGGDGRYWDCIQLIYLDKTGKIDLHDKSPLWRAVINGREVEHDSIDLSYIKMVQAFIRGDESKLWGPEDIIAAHKKTHDLISNIYYFNRQKDYLA